MPSNPHKNINRPEADCQFFHMLMADFSCYNFGDSLTYLSNMLSRGHIGDHTSGISKMLRYEAKRSQLLRAFKSQTKTAGFCYICVSF